MAAAITGRRVYRNDPIQEAICEFRFREPQGNWPILPGQMYEQLKDIYPAQAAQAPLMSTDVTPPAAPFGFQVMVGQIPVGMVRLTNDDETAALLVGAGNIAVMSRRPYGGWEAFSSTIRRVLSTFSETVRGEFVLDRVGVRYVNRLDVSMESLEKFFDIRPLNIAEVPLNLRNFVARSELNVEGDTGRLVIATFASAVKDNRPEGFILDIDTIAQDLQGIDEVEPALGVVDELHRLEKSVFEASIREATRVEVFGGYEEVPY